jgi:hypothetical protein
MESCRPINVGPFFESDAGTVTYLGCELEPFWRSPGGRIRAYIQGRYQLTHRFLKKGGSVNSELPFEIGIYPIEIPRLTSSENRHVSSLDKT